MHESGPMKARSWSAAFRYIAYGMWFVSAITFLAASEETGLLTPSVKQLAKWVSYFSLLWCVAEIARQTNRLLQLAELRAAKDPDSAEHWIS